jgi:hypothetical protein
MIQTIQNSCQLLIGVNFSLNFFVAGKFKIFEVQQGLEMRGCWFQKKSVQLKTAFREVTPM